MAKIKEAATEFLTRKRGSPCCGGPLPDGAKLLVEELCLHRGGAPIDSE